MAEQQQKLKNKTEKDSLIRKCEMLADISSSHSKRSMFSMISFSQGLKKNDQECLEHFTDTLTSYLEIISTAFEILCSIECPGTGKVRYDSILSETATTIMETVHLNSQVKQDHIKQMAKKEEMKNEVIEILDDVDDAIDCSKEINVGQNSAGNQTISTRFRSDIDADPFIASVMRDLPPTDSGLETANTSSSNQDNCVAITEKENSQTEQSVEENSSDITSFVIEREDADDLYLSGIPLCQMQSVCIDLTQGPDNQGVISYDTELNIPALDEDTQFREVSTSEDVISNSEELFPVSIPRRIYKNKKPSSEFSQQRDYESNKRAKIDTTFNSDERSADHTKIKSTTDESQQVDDRANLKLHSEGDDNNIESTKNADMQSLPKAAMDSLNCRKLKSTIEEGQESGYEENLKQVFDRNIQPHLNESSLKSNTSRNWGSHNEEGRDQRAETTTEATLGTCTKESRDWNADTILESCENNESLIKKQHGDVSRETNFLRTPMRRSSSNDFDYDKNLLVLSRVSPYQEIIRRARGRRRGRGRGRGKSLIARNEVKGKENAVTKRCRGGSMKKPRGRPKGSGRGKVNLPLFGNLKG